MTASTDPSTPIRRVLAGRYRVDREIGRGGMATVYLARDLKHDRWVALKVMRSDLAAAIGPERFLREIAIAARLNHPHVLALHDSGEAEGMLFYIMPFVDGESLRDRLRREGQLPIDDALRITRQVAAGLAHAHGVGVIHRDIKPENILLVEGHALVADFGVARALDAADSETLTQTGLAIGTPAYMSPEQAFGDRAIDARSDLYSLACVVYEMLTGEAPWRAATAQATLARRLTDPVPSIRSVRDTVSPATEAAIVRALSRSPADRFGSVADFVTALDSVAEPPRARPGADAIAVLDFTNLSKDPALDWLSTGLAETVTVDLRKLPGVRVIPRQAVARSVATRGERPIEQEDLRALGAALGARWIVRGSFQSAGGRVRIMPEFHEAATGDLLRASKLDGAVDDLFTLQDRIVEDLMEVLDAPLSTSDQIRIARPETSELKAYEAYARGLQIFYRFGEKAFQEAEGHYRRAVELDPGYALAHAGLGSLAMFRFIATTDPADLERGIERLQRAIELDPDLADAHHWLCYAYFRAKREEEALAAGERATTLDPGNALAWYFLATAQLIHGSHLNRWELFVAAARSYRRSIEEDPTHLPTYMGLAWLYMVAGRYDVAARVLDRALQIEASGKVRGHVLTGGAQLLRAVVCIRQGELDRASSLFAEAHETLRKIEHVYRDLFSALVFGGQGEVAYRRREFDVAVDRFARSMEVVAAHPRRLGMGIAQVRALLGQARAFHGLGMRREAADRFAEGERLIETREGFDFSWGWESSEATMYFDLAYARAAFGRWSEVSAALEQAVDAGWNETRALGDPLFGPLARDGTLERLTERLRHRAPLPDPAAVLADPG